MTFRLVVVCLAVLLLPASVFAQGNPIAQRIEQRLQESQKFFDQGDYLMGANRLSEAASMLRGSQGAMSGNPVGMLAGGLNTLTKKGEQAKGDRALSRKILLAEEPLLNSLCMYEPQNPQWFYQRAIVHMVQSGGPSVSGTAGDRQALKFAIKDFDTALTCPNNSAIVASANQMKTACERELTKRQAMGAEIQRRGARQFARVYGMKGDDSKTNYGSSLCTVCGHFHGSGAGECNYRRD